jgi:hypothetical protein
MNTSDCCGASDDMCEEIGICPKCKDHCSFEPDSDYEYYEAMAIESGWETPVNDALGEESWINYWKQLERLKNGEASGRPIIPHRSA